MPARGTTQPGKFDLLFAEGQQALLGGRQYEQRRPAHNDMRWGIAAALRPDPAAASAVEHAAREAAAIADGGHWLAGAVASSHLTLRAGLERYRTSVPADDPLVARYAAAMHNAVDGIGPIRFAVTGLTLTPMSVMACATPADSAADDLASAFGDALSAGGQPATGITPDIWYLNLIYFTGPVRNPQRLIDWVAARRHTALTAVRVTDIQIVRWRYTSTGMVPIALASARPSGR